MSARPIHRQSGAALVIALILLTIMTLLGMSVLRSTLLDERMSAGLFDRGLAFQSAEGALREAETRIAGTPAASFPANGCDADGLCAAIDRAANATAPERWADPAFAGWEPTGFNPGALAGAQPEYIAELMGPAPNWPGCEQEVPMHPNCMTPRYRITARSGAAGRSQVVLQSNFASTAP